jgi:hypothetical protein
MSMIPNSCRFPTISPYIAEFLLSTALSLINGLHGMGMSIWNEDCPLTTDRIRRYTPSWPRTGTEASIRVGIEWIDLLKEVE